MAPDGDQLSRARPGNDAEFIALIARHRDRFLRYATHMLGSREDAEETVQDTFVRIHRGLARADPERVDAWAFRILVNRVRSAAARRRWWRRIAARLERAETIPAPEHEDGAWQDEIDRALEVLLGWNSGRRS
ncbi:MAG: sigma-70 family RNA polymerase sigma factor [Gemmatimonadales bacterium]